MSKLEKAVKEFIYCIDGSYGKSWSQVANELDKQDPYSLVSFTPEEVAKLLKAAIEEGVVG